MSEPLESKTASQKGEEPSLQSTEQSTELRILKGIRQAEEGVVIAIESALKEGEYPKSGRDELQASQFRNLVRVADTTESPEVVKNFLRYQVGREKKWGRGEKSLAERIVRDIDGDLKTWAAAIAKEANSPDKRRIHMELIRRYLGYGSRRLRYLSLAPGEKVDV